MVLDDAVFTAQLKVDHATRKQKLALSLALALTAIAGGKEDERLVVLV